MHAGDKDSSIIYVYTVALYMYLTPCPLFRVWDIKTGQVINNLHHHKRYETVNTLKFTADTLVTGADVSGPQKHFHYVYICGKVAM